MDVRSKQKLGWRGLVQLGLVELVQSGIQLGRRILPRFLRRRLAGLAAWVETRILTPRMILGFKQRQIALVECQPIFSKAEFAAGPVVLANNALAAGGVERQVVNTLRGLDQKGIPSGLLCLRLHDSPDLDFFLPTLGDFSGFVRNIMNIAYAKTVLANVAPEILSNIGAATAWLPQDVQTEILRFAAEFTNLKPSVVHAWQDSTNIAAAYAAWLVGVPRILVSTRNLTPIHFPYFKSYMPHAYREIADCPTITMVSNSEAGARDYTKWLGVPRDRFVVKRNGLDSTAIRRPSPSASAALRAKLGIPAESEVVGSIFRFYREKRPLLWIETVARIARQRPNCHFVVFGDPGPMLQSAMSLAKQRGLTGRLHCPGPIDDPALGLSIFTVFLLTSEFEGTPNVLLEASLMGVPAVATDAGGTGEAVAEGITGCIATKADSGELAERVLSILDDPAWSTRVGIEGRIFVERKFGLARMLDETIALYRSAALANRAS